VCALPLAGPVAWDHYLVLVIWPAWMLGERLRARGWPNPQSRWFLLAAGLMQIPLLCRFRS
jgi:hypothetical protein